MQGKPRLMRFKAHVTAVLACAVLGGCGGVTIPPATFDLRPPRVMTVTAPKPARFQLVVNEPSAVRSLGTNRILVKPDPEQVTYYKGAAWSDQLPRLVQARMVQAFQNAGLVRAVGSRADRLDADLELASQLNAFQVEINQGDATAHVSLYVKVIDGKRGRMVASRAFETRVPTSYNNATVMVASLNEAFDSVMRDVVPWVASVKSQ